MVNASSVERKLDALLAAGFELDHRNGRAWVAVLQWPGLGPVHFGSILVDRKAATHEVEAAVRAEADKLVPAGYSIVNLVPGRLVFLPEAEVKAAA